MELFNQGGVAKTHQRLRCCHRHDRRRQSKVKLVMPACVSVDRRGILEAYGVKVLLSPGCEMTDGAIRLAHRILAENPATYYMSSGAAVAGALTLARGLNCATIVVLLPDHGDRYLNTNLFRSHCAECPP